MAVKNSKINSIKEKLIFFLKIAFSLGLIGVLVYRGDLDFAVIFSAQKPHYLILCFLLTTLSLIVNNHRWTLLLWSRGFKTPWKETASLSLMGLFFNFSLPSSVGGDVVKAYYLASDNKNQKGTAITSVVVDRILGLFAMLGLANLSFLLNMDRIMASNDLKSIAVLTSLILLGLCVFAGLVFSKKLRESYLVNQLIEKGPGALKKVYLAFSSFGDSKKTLLKAIGLSFISQGSVVLFIYFFSLALGIDNLPFSLFLFVVPIGLIVMAIPVAPAGVGIGQVAFLTLFQMYLGEKSQVGQLGITAFQLSLLSLGLIGAFLYLKRKKNLNIEEIEELNK